MISTARLLKEKSPSPQQEKGWLELPNGKRFQPTPARLILRRGAKSPICQRLKNAAGLPA